MSHISWGEERNTFQLICKLLNFFLFRLSSLTAGDFSAHSEAIRQQVWAYKWIHLLECKVMTLLSWYLPQLSEPSQ